jgi:hypothetical protein
MISAEPQDLAFSMIHLYGKKRALTLADRYAADCSMNADHHGHNRWARAASMIGNLIAAEERLAMLRSHPGDFVEVGTRPHRAPIWSLIMPVSKNKKVNAAETERTRARGI